MFSLEHFNFDSNSEYRDLSYNGPTKAKMSMVHGPTMRRMVAPLIQHVPNDNGNKQLFNDGKPFPCERRGGAAPKMYLIS